MDRTDKTLFGGCVVIGLVIIAIVASVAYWWHSRNQRFEERQARILALHREANGAAKQAFERETGDIPTKADNGFVTGKVIVVDVDVAFEQPYFSDSRLEVPDDLRPDEPEEVGTFVAVKSTEKPGSGECREVRSGRTSLKTPSEYHLATRLIDRKTGSVVAIKDLDLGTDCSVPSYGDKLKSYLGSLPRR